MHLFFILYVRPILEYGSTVWNPIAQCDINALENVQRYFTNRIPGCVFLPYKQRLTILSLDSLQKRRSVADLVCFYSIMSGSLNSFLSPHINLLPPSITRGHNLRINSPTLHFAISERNFLSRICTAWNKLPASILSSNSRTVFRKRVTLHCADPYR